MKKVFVMAYTKFNLGDDLFIHVLSDRYPHTKFILYAPKEYKTVFNKKKNIKVYSSDLFFNRVTNYILRRVFNYSIEKIIKKKVDAIVHIGGSIFMENKNWRKRQTTRKNIFKKPYYVIGANFGPYKTEEFYQSYKIIFKNYNDICFRDTYSYKLFQDMNNVRVADDVVFNLQPRIQSTEKIVVISVIKPSYRKNLINKDNEYYLKIKELIEKFNENNYKVFLMSFCRYEGDLDAIYSIKRLLPQNSNVSFYSYENNIEGALDIISKAEFMIATRFHAMILGWLYKKPTLPIAYSEKMTNVMKDVGYNGMYVDFDKLECLDFIRVYNDLKENSVDVSKQILRSEKHFYELDKLLNRTK